LRTAQSDTFVVFLTPLRLLKNIGKEYYYKLVDKYERDHGTDFPREIIFNNDSLKTNFWMDKKLESGELKALIEKKSKRYVNLRSTEGIKSEEEIQTGSKLLIDTLT
jgi:hypothetical protein